MRKLFGTDGIRGKANCEPLTAPTTTRLAQAIGQYFKKESPTPLVVIGKDTRLSCYMLESALAAGFTSVGMDVVLLGVTPTPSVALLTRILKADVGVMISASHNPFSDNGIKLFGPDGFKLQDHIEKEIEQIFESAARSLESTQPGRIVHLNDGNSQYIQFLKDSLPKDICLKHLKIVIDCAHGAAYDIAPSLLGELGAEVIPLHVSPNGCNINEKSGAIHPSVLSQKVIETKAHLGIAFDGDADRVVFVDEQGRIVDGDQIMALIATDWYQKGKLSSQVVVATIMSNLALENYLSTLGIQLIRTSVGDRYVVEKMREGAYSLGGEQSGHIILGDYATAGDALLTTLQVLAILSEKSKPASEVLHVFDPAPQVLKNIPLDPHILQTERVKDIIAQTQSQLGTKGRLVVRASGTEALVRVMVEAEDPEIALSTVDDVIQELKACTPALNLREVL